MALALHFDPYAGISAAAALGALVDAGLAPEALRAELAKLGLGGWTLAAERVTAGVTGTRVTIAAEGEDNPWTLGRVRDLLDRSALSPAVRARSLRALTRLAASSGWGEPRDDDPAGTLDTILAVVGVVVGLDLLGVTEVSTAAPPRGIAGSPVTPAADALLATLATERPPALRLRQVGYGLGPADPHGPHPAAVRVWLGEPEADGLGSWQTLLAPATAGDNLPGALLLVADRADEVGPEYDRLVALAAAWAGIPARLCAFSGAREGTGPSRLTRAIEDVVAAGARRVVVQRLDPLADPTVEEGLAGVIRWARGRWPDRQFTPALPLLTGRQLAYRLAGRATEAAEAEGTRPSPLDPSETALLLLAPGSADAEANADAYRLARLVWEGRGWLTVEVAFAAGAAPDPAAAILRCQRLGARQVIALPILPLAGSAFERMAAQVAAAGAATPGLPVLLGRPLGTAEGFAAIAWERYREAIGLPTGDAAHGHSHGPGGGHGPLIAIRPILPPRYQGDAPVNSAPMGAADLVYDDDGRVDWGAIWGAFCDLAIAGGPPHRGTLLEPPTREEVLARPDEYGRVLDELARGLRLITGWPIIRDAAPGWIGLVCPDEEAAIWLLRAVLTENVAARREGVTLFLPAGPAFRIGEEIKNVITAVAKTHHYWTEHMAALAGEAGLPPTGQQAGGAVGSFDPEPPVIEADSSNTGGGKRRYEYECAACATRFDLERSVAEAGLPAPCPFCGQPSRRVFSAPRLLFKADPRASQPVWHNHGGYGHAHAPGKGFHGAGARQRGQGRGERGE